MPRLHTVIHEDGSATLKLRVPSIIWSLAGRLASRWELSQEHALRILLDQFAAQLRQTRGAVMNTIVEEAFEALLAEDAIPLDGVAPIDVGKLHRSPRKNSASGFVGVYPNGRHFRAQAKDPRARGQQVSIGTFPTAERAAWERYLFYQKHNMAYGAAEDALAEKGTDIETYTKYLRDRLGREPTDAEVVAEVNQSRREGGMPEIPWAGKLPEPQVVVREVPSASAATQYPPELEAVLDAPERRR